jgi:uncharacterized protein (DUF983 family)
VQGCLPEVRIFVPDCDCIMKKGSRLYSVFYNKCPKCQEGDFFVSKHAYDLKNFTKMNARCAVCDESFDPEPGFYFGAMYFSYAINVAVMVVVWVVCELLFPDISVWWTVLFTIITGLVLTPLTFRWSRLAWINLFVKYRTSGKTT